jgi:hypothetical protein
VTNELFQYNGKDFWKKEGERMIGSAGGDYMRWNFLIAKILCQSIDI